MNAVAIINTWYLKEANAQRSVLKVTSKSQEFKWKKMHRWLVVLAKNVLAAATVANLNLSAWNATVAYIWIQRLPCVPLNVRGITS